MSEWFVDSAASLYDMLYVIFQSHAIEAPSIDVDWSEEQNYYRVKLTYISAEIDTFFYDGEEFKSVEKVILTSIDNEQGIW